MARKKIQIKKIDNLTAHQLQVTLLKRRGVFKKTQEPSTLCDAEIALIIFSALEKSSIVLAQGFLISSPLS
ncbi:MADS-box SVP-like isoform X1, partial [Olea europaea subsp. europaea]